MSPNESLYFILYLHVCIRFHNDSEYGTDLIRIRIRNTGCLVSTILPFTSAVLGRYLASSCTTCPTKKVVSVKKKKPTKHYVQKLFFWLKKS